MIDIIVLIIIFVFIVIVSWKLASGLPSHVAGRAGLPPRKRCPHCGEYINGCGYNRGGG